MIIVGELINASRKVIAAAIENKDKDAIQKIAREQHEAGAHYLDVNVGTFVEKEAEYMKWLVTTVQYVVDGPCSIDSPNPKAIEASLSVHQGTPLINSISLEKERYNDLLPMLADTDYKVVALCMSDEGMPKTAEERLKIADKLINGLVQNNVPLNNIYVDPLVQPVSVNQSFGVECLKAIELIKDNFEGVHAICGLSNISFGLPGRKFINQSFMTMAISRGLDGAIINPLDKRMMASIIAAEALAGNDSYCKNYIQTYRAKKLEF
jgi:5-methyltetrahydrofolate--homocysteine methyltransferase